MEERAQEVEIMIQRIAYTVFGRYFRSRRSGYESLHGDLVKSRFGTSIDHWLSTAFFTSLLTAIISILIIYGYAVLTGGEILECLVASSFGAGVLTSLVFLRYRFFGTVESREKSKKIASKRKSGEPLLSPLAQVFLFLVGFILFLGLSPTWLLEAIHRGLVGIFTMIAFGLASIAPYFIFSAIPLAFFFVTLSMFLVYPKLKLWERKRKINGLASSAISLMGSVAGVGLTPYDSMKFLAKEKSYGEAADEMTYLVRDVELFGKDFVTALERLAKTTPSEKLKAFLQGAITTITSGGDLREYFVDKSEEYSRSDKREMNKFLDTLGLLAEIYVIMGIVLPTILIIMFSIMTIMGGVPVMMLYAAILIVPIATLVTIAMADSSEPAYLKGSR